MDQHKPSLKTRLSSHFSRYSRVWHLLKKPSFEEFKLVSKVSALGILLVGLIGFIISVVMSFL